MHRSPFIKKSVASLSQPFGLDPFVQLKTHTQPLIDSQAIHLSLSPQLAGSPLPSSSGLRLPQSRFQKTPWQIRDSLRP